MDEPVSTARKALRHRWIVEEKRIALIVSAVRRGDDWTSFLKSFKIKREMYEALPLIEARDLRGLRLENVDLSNVSLQGVSLNYAQFFSVNLKSAILSSERTPSNFAGGTLLRCQFDHADLTAAVCTQAHFGHCTLSGSQLCGANLDSATLRRCQLKRADCRGSSLRDVNYIYSDLADIHVSEATDFGSGERGQQTSPGEPKIRLRREAEIGTFDRFQFANQAEAFESAAAIYSTLASAYANSDLDTIAEWWRGLERACLKQARKKVC